MKDVHGARGELGPGFRAAFGSFGLLALVVSIFMLVWRESTATTTTGLIALAAVVAGVCIAYRGIRDNTSGWYRGGQVALGILLVTVGLVAFANLGQTTLWLSALVGLLTAILWTIEGAVSLSTWGDAVTTTWSIVLALLSLLAGIGLLLTPAWGSMILWWLLGFSLFVLGVANIARAFTREMPASR